MGGGFAFHAYCCINIMLSLAQIVEFSKKDNPCNVLTYNNYDW